MKERLLEMGIDEENCNKILEMLDESIGEKDKEIADIKLNYEIENARTLSRGTRSAGEERLTARAMRDRTAYGVKEMT